MKNLLGELRPFVESRSSFTFREGRFYSACLRAGFVRSFEFAELSFKTRRNNCEYFLAPALRGIVEDLIYLRFLSSITNHDRELIVTKKMTLEVTSKLEKQSSFFGLFRPFQPILGPGSAEIRQTKEEIRDVFRRNGWPNLNSDSPPTIELARKCEPGVLEVVYEFIYRLTSGLVHFSPQILLRSGWGNTKSKTKFSTQNMNEYYRRVSQIYGCFIFILYLEFFGRFLKPGDEVRVIITKLRESLLRIFRWPEMVTFEEMNQPVPQPEQFRTMIIYSMYAVMQKDGFIRSAGATVYNK